MKKLPVGVFIIGALFATVGLFSLGRVALTKLGLFSDRSQPSSLGKTEEALFSFFLDDDDDGLTNAWEYIFNSDPNNPDTSGDDKSDAEKVSLKLDPRASFEDRPLPLSLRENNLSVKFYFWAKEKKGYEAPIPNQELLSEFYLAEGKDLLRLARVPDTDIIQAPDDGLEVAAEYFAKLATLPLPAVSSDYNKIAQALGQDDYQSGPVLVSLGSDRQNLQASYLAFTRVPVPASLVEVHKDYLTILATLDQMFQDLEQWRSDPIRAMLNAYLNDELFKLVQGLQDKKTKILESYPIKSQQ